MTKNIFTGEVKNSRLHSEHGERTSRLNPQYRAGFAEQGDDPLNRDQRELGHVMSCTKSGCTRCGS